MTHGISSISSTCQQKFSSPAFPSSSIPCFSKLLGKQACQHQCPTNSPNDSIAHMAHGMSQPGWEVLMSNEPHPIDRM